VTASNFQISFFSKLKDFFNGQNQLDFVNTSVSYQLLPLIDWGHLEKYKARQEFRGKKNNIFDFSSFHLATIRHIFDLMHGLDIEKLTLATVVEMMIFCNYDGKITQKSEFETTLFQTLVDLIV